MNTKLLLFFILCCNAFSLFSMQEVLKVLEYKAEFKSDQEYSFRIANQDDAFQLLDLINTQAIHDSDKIVILPKLFREISLRSSIDKGRIFVAESLGKIVGYKKIFLINDVTEKRDILINEIRCIDNEVGCTFSCLINNEGRILPAASSLYSDCYNLCIYNGGDFTLPAFRGKGINQQLTTYALLQLIEDIKQQVILKDVKTITMVYGVTQSNAGKYPGGSSDRLNGICKSFRNFIKVLEEKDGISIEFQHKRYLAFMPTFDPESTVLCPLPDEHSIEGFGCTLTYQFKESHE